MLKIVEKPATGTILIAHPVIRDPNFRRVVVLLCEHNEDGTYGLVLNRPTPFQLSEIVETPNVESPLFLGGPVQPNTLHILHRIGTRIYGSKEIQNQTFWGGKLEEIAHLIDTEEATPKDVRFFVGYSGWGEGQLDDEIEKGGWIIATLDDSIIFDTDPLDMWRSCMRKMGGEFALISTYPDDPSMN